MQFGSDNWAGAAPEIMAAVAAANDGDAPAYGADRWTADATRLFAETFERDVAVFFVGTGGAANGLALSTLSPPYGSIVCHEAAHVQMDECAGPEFFTGGAKLIAAPGPNGKLTPESLSATLGAYPHRPPHGSPFAALTLTQATEYGTVYAEGEIAALCALARDRGLAVHMDGARFANAVAALGASPADLTWRAGVDVLSFGGTKNGCLGAEAVIFSDPDKAADFAFRRKRAGHLFSKTRFLAAQFVAYLEDNLWLRLADHANRMAAELSAQLADIEGCRVWTPTEVNEVFVSFPEPVEKRLLAAGAAFFPWVTPGDPAAGRMRRLICSFATTPDDVARFVEIAGGGPTRSRSVG